MCFLSFVVAGCAAATDTSALGGGGAADPVTWAGPTVSLQDCDGVERTFGSLAQPRGLFVALGAAWCAPCQADAPEIQAFSAANPDIGVVQVLVQDEDGSPATTLACTEWTETFALAHTVVIDPVFVTEPIVGDQGFPVHVAYTPAGEEAYREAGAFEEGAVLAALPAG